MNVKRCINFIRGILYVQEVVRWKSISRAAEENNLKASNLSIIIKNLENQIGVKLFERSPLGCRPTLQGLKMSQEALELQNQIYKLCKLKGNDFPSKKELNIYIAPNMNLTDYEEFEGLNPDIKLNIVEEKFFADVEIDNFPPKNGNRAYTELSIGAKLKQKIWISCNENNLKAMAFFDFIVAKLLALYDQ